MAKMGLLPVPGVKRVTIRRADKSLFAINTPDVYKLADTFVVFGEAKVEDANTIQQRAAEQARREQKDAGKQEFEEESADEEDEGEVDEEGVEAKDIDLVVSQTNCSRAKAVEALKANDNDIVNAVMSLSM
jgi:nascent polypeptide-associated complex subunit alpha